MTINWDSIKYITQIPQKWYKWIHNKISHMYGESFIVVKQDGYNDGIQIGIDQDAFAEEVKKVTGETENPIYSVDNVGPDSSGNVPLHAVRSVNGEYYPDDSGNLNIPYGDGKVKKVDNVEPDSSGNVSLGAITTTDVTTQGTIVGLDYVGDYTVPSAVHGHKVSDLDDIKDKTTGNWMFVKSVNTTIKPDKDGNINLPLPSGKGFIVSSVDGVEPTDEKGEVKLGAVRSVQVGNGEDKKLKPDANGNLDLKDYIGGTVKTVNNVEPDDDGDVDLGDIVYSVNGEVPVNGDVTIDIPKSISDLPNDAGYTKAGDVTNIFNQEIGKLTLTHTDITDWNTATATFLEVDEVEDLGVTAGLDYAGDKPVCPTNHGHKLNDITDWDDNIKDKLDDDFVTIDTEQIVSGKKLFTSTLNVAVAKESGETGVQFLTSGAIGIKGDSPNIGFCSKDSQVDDIGNISTTEYGGLQVYARKSNLVLGVNSNEDNQVQLVAKQDYAVLWNPPSDGCVVNNAIATVGWVKKNAGAVKSIDTDYKPDDSGNIELKAVRTEGDQTIGGSKTFTSTVYVNNSNGVGGYFPHAVVLTRASGNPWIGFCANNSSSSQSSITGSPTTITMACPKGYVKLSAPKNNAILENAPDATTSTTSLAIATVGWVNSNTLKIGTTSTTAAAGNHTHSGYANVTHTHPHTSISDWSSATSTFLESIDVETAGTTVSKSGSYDRYVCPTAHGHSDADVLHGDKGLYTFLGGSAAASYARYEWYLVDNSQFVRNLKVDGKSATIDTSRNATVDFGLAGNSIVMTDADGHLTTGDTGKSEDITIVTGISWTNNQIQATRKTLKFTNGILTSTSNATTQTINTTTYTGS